MAIRIPLPTIIRRPEAKIHPYPYQISTQTLEFLQASLFYASFVDIATGEYARLPNGMAEIERKFTEKLYSKETYDEAWGYLAKYRAVFEKTAFQSVLIALNSHWDWYIRKLVDFILFARSKIGGPNLEKDDQKRMDRVAYLPIGEQLKVLELAAGIELPLSDPEKSELYEMTLVRNLGLHNRCEVDSRYLDRSPRKGLAIGKVRVIEIDELYSWHRLLLSLVNSSAREVALAFVRAPDYP